MNHPAEWCLQQHGKQDCCDPPGTIRVTSRYNLHVLGTVRVYWSVIVAGELENIVEFKFIINYK